MANKMLIDATHPEETRVVVLRGNRVEEFDFESAHRKQLRGNIYLAKVTRVEPSLQAAFVDYGGNRHGFLAFSEIHPDYYQIPVADREALIAEEERAQRAADDEVDRRSRRHRRQPAPHRSARRDETVQGEITEAHDAAAEGHFEEAHGEQAHGENGEATDIEARGSAAAEGTPHHHDASEPVVTRTISADALNASEDHAETDDEADEPLEALAESATEVAANDVSEKHAEDGEAADDHNGQPDDHGDETVSTAPAENGDTTTVTEVHEHDEEGEAPRRSSNRSAVRTRSKKYRTAPRATAASTKSKR